MNAARNGTLLRIFTTDSDRHEGKPLYEALVLRAREQRLAGATVLRGVIGYGKASRIHSARIEAISTGLPVVVEIIDLEERITAFLPQVQAMAPDALVTLEQVTVLRPAALE